MVVVVVLPPLGPIVYPILYLLLERGKGTV
jgi:hypothetical protein